MVFGGLWLGITRSWGDACTFPVELFGGSYDAFWHLKAASFQLALVKRFVLLHILLSSHIFSWKRERGDGGAYVSVSDEFLCCFV